jgi:hypothetical protein
MVISFLSLADGTFPRVFGGFEVAEQFGEFSRGHLKLGTELNE